MAQAKQFLNELYAIAESFSGIPVRIISSTLRDQKSEKEQAEVGFKIHVPFEIRELDMFRYSEQRVFNAYKGIVSLQASAIKYRGVPKSKEEFDFTSIDSLDQFSLSGYYGELLPNFYNLAEISRRLQCIKEEYLVLYEDMRDGMSGLFNSQDFSIEKVIPVSRYEKDRDVRYGITVNEIDFALSRVYWRNFGVDEKTLEIITRNIPPDSDLGNYREDIIEVTGGLVYFQSPLTTSYRDSIERTRKFKEFAEKLFLDIGFPNPFRRVNYEEMAIDDQKRAIKEFSGELAKDAILRNIESRKKELEELLQKEDFGGEVGLETKEDVRKRLDTLGKNQERILASNSASIFTGYSIQSPTYASNPLTLGSVRKVFYDMPFSQIISPEIPVKFKEEETGKSIFLPELRERVLTRNAVRLIVYDLLVGRPISEQQFLRENELISEISKLEEKVERSQQAVQREFNYVYSSSDFEKLKKQQKDCGILSRELKRKKKELESSRKIREKLGEPRFSFDRDLARKVAREMEKIKPEELAIIQGCLDGEVDYKRYYDYWLAKQNNEHPIPNYFYQWQRKLRDVASVILIDASSSTGRSCNEKDSMLDKIKEASFIISVAADSLEDKIAVFAYNGRSSNNVRAFILKDFSEKLNVLEKRLGLLQPELNNRDGAAIRYASQFLLSAKSKSKFLFFLSDMQPSDVEFEVENPVIKTYRYSGENALNDVFHAYQTARSHGIIPCGICIKPFVQMPGSVTEQICRRKKAIINQALLQKLRETKKKDIQTIDECLRKNFRRNYRIVNDLSLLPKVLKDLYLEVSFN